MKKIILLVFVLVQSAEHFETRQKIILSDLFFSFFQRIMKLLLCFLPYIKKMSRSRKKLVEKKLGESEIYHNNNSLYIM